MASHPLIEAHLSALVGRLPAGVADELVDGLTETFEHHLRRGADRAEAARSAIAEFGEPGEIMAAFARQAPGRRTAIVLLATGPIAAACWGAALFLGGAWGWPIPAPAKIGFAGALLGVVALLLLAATSKRSYARTRLAALGGAGLVLLDAAMLGAVLIAAPAPVWPMALAIPVSLARIAFTLPRLPAALA